MATDVSLTGGCHCGRVRFRIDAPLRAARSCHCSRCRKIFSGAGSAYAEIAPGSLVWIAGADECTRYATSAGWGLNFCRTCGTTLCGLAGEEIHGVTLGSIDGDPGVQIEMHLFVSSKAPWDHIGGDAPQYAEHAPPDRAR
ncbi:MAG: GFA family protein [Nannocystaceae bacterium]